MFTNKNSSITISLSLLNILLRKRKQNFFTVPENCPLGHKW